MVIWTKHFTQFAAYTQTTNSTSSSSGATGGDGGDGLGCAVHDCSGVHPAIQNLVLGVLAPRPAAGFAPGILGAQTTTEDVGIGEIGQVQGEVTRSAQVSPTPQPQETQTTPFDAKVLLIVGVALLFCFGVFKLIIK